MNFPLACWQENIIHWRTTKAMIKASIFLSYWWKNLSMKKYCSLWLFAGNCRVHSTTPSKHLHFPPNFRPLTSHYFWLTTHKCHLWQHWGGYRWWPKGLFVSCGMYAILPCQGTEGWREASEQESLTSCNRLKPDLNLTLSCLFGVNVFLFSLIFFSVCI